MHVNGDGNDPYCALAFRGIDPLDERFEAIALSVFAPLLAAVEQE
jgi:hypothetical protein